MFHTVNVFESLQLLEKLLPTKPDEPGIGPEDEEVDMIDMEGTRGFESGGRKDAYNEDDSDDDEGMAGGHRVGCAQQ